MEEPLNRILKDIVNENNVIGEKRTLSKWNHEEWVELAEMLNELEPESQDIIFLKRLIGYKIDEENINRDIELLKIYVENLKRLNGYKIDEENINKDIKNIVAKLISLQNRFKPKYVRTRKTKSVRKSKTKKSVRKSKTKKSVRTRKPKK